MIHVKVKYLILQCKDQNMTMSTEANSRQQSLESLVHAENLQLLFKQSFPAVFVSIAISLLLTAVLWSVQDHGLLLAWLYQTSGSLVPPIVMHAVNNMTIILVVAFVL